MRVEVALCQARPAPGDPEFNAEAVSRSIMSEEADVLIYPEGYLTGYGVSPEGLEEEINAGVHKISDLCRKFDKAVALGTARMSPRGPVNSLLFLSPDGDTAYDKTHLAKFGIYSEDGFVPGDRAGMGSYHGLRFGLCICYDIYFPEILHGCSLRGADVNVCISAAAVQSSSCFDKVLPARALENVTYLAFVNNVGENPSSGLRMAGCSRALSPLGDTLVQCSGDSEEVARFTVNTEELARTRGIRRHLADFRRDVNWLGQNF